MNSFHTKFSCFRYRCSATASLVKINEPCSSFICNPRSRVTFWRRTNPPIGVYFSHLVWRWRFGFCAVISDRLYTRGRIIGLDELGKTFVVRLVIRRYRIEPGTRRILRRDELSSVVCRSSRTAEEYSSRRMCLVPVFILNSEGTYLSIIEVNTNWFDFYHIY